MSCELSFRALAGQLQAGEQGAAALVFKRFAHRLLGLAATRLAVLLRPKMDPEDVVQSVFRSFFARQSQGQFELHGWDEVWHVLLTITLRKCCNWAEHFHAACRDVRREVPLWADAEVGDPGWEALARDPGPAEAAELVETIEELLRRFDEREQSIVRLGLQGYPVVEISAQVGCSERKVYRVLQRVRAELERAAEADQQAA